MTTDTIESLEARLAAMTKPCSQSNSFHEGLTQLDDHLCKECKGERVIPMIAGSRRECPDRVSVATWVYSDSGELDMEHGSEHPVVCRRCDGLGYVPDLDGMKVEAWMLEQDGSLEIDTRAKGIEVLWQSGKYEFVKTGRGATLYEALLRACLAGLEAEDGKPIWIKIGEALEGEHD